MKTRGSRILATWYCVAVCLFMGVGPDEGLVLCFGADGHIEVSAPAADCNGCSEQFPEGEPGPRGSGLDAGPSCCLCLDVPVMSEGGVADQKLLRPSLERSALLLATLPVLELPRERPRDRARLGPPPPADTGSALSRLRSVILLI